ncbi:MAG: 2-C-methyl-D-erythritol 4-phosphate cytidylyltransferase [Dehalococcoidales bacterium]|jgi:2-C-methyl-D-erythritol 4-phosphate cytidylyltransferase
MNQKAGAIIAAGGSSRRMGEIDKLFAPLGGRPVLAHVLDAFQNCEPVDRIVLVVNRDNLTKAEELVAENSFSKVSDVVAGGERRQDSVAAGLAKLTGCDWVIVHDGARPFVTPELIEHGLEAARESGAAIAAIPVKDTIKLANTDDFVLGTPPRANLWQVQTPQVFRYDILAAAYRNLDEDVTDDAALVEKAGFKVKLYMGDEINLKITTRVDLSLAEVLINYVK